MEKLKFSHVAILGMGVSGKAVADFFIKKGISRFGIDKTPFFYPHTPIYSEEELSRLNGVDLVVKSPGISFEHPWVKEAVRRNIRVIGEIDLAFDALKNKEIIGVTGSNGKTTTTLFLTHLLNCMGRKAMSTGNVGVPLISQVDSPCETLVVELSSFQLEQVLPYKALDKAIILNITANHLDRHASFKEYVDAKCKIQTCLKKEGKLFTNQEIIEKFGIHADNFEIYQEKVETFFPLRYRVGKNRIFKHDVQNYAAAFAAALPDDEHFLHALETFQKPPHRIEFVKEIRGIAFFNDSKATSIDAVIKAVSCMDAKVFLLAGGVDKGGSYRDWLPACIPKIERILVFGKAADRILKELSDKIAVERVETLEEGIKKAASLAQPGDVVLLSPGCASYDQFKDYQHRGEVFKSIVNTL